MKIFIFVILISNLVFAKLEINNSPDGGDYTFTIDQVVTIKSVLKSDNDKDLKSEISFPKSADYKIINQSFGGTSSSTQVSFVNGQMTKIVDKSSIYYTQLKFNKIGIFQIASPFVVKDGKPIYGNSIKISIANDNNGTEDEKLNPKMWFYVKSSKVNTSIGEQITLTVEFGPRDGVPISQLSAPDIKKIKEELSKKFIVEELFREEKDLEKLRSQQERNGQMYSLYQFQYVLYPFQSGSINIGPFDINYAIVENVRGGRNNDPFNMFFSRRQEKKAVKESNLWTINIKEREFTAGSFKLKSSISADSIMVGEPISLTATITGKGNTKSLLIPNYSDNKDFVTYSPEISHDEVKNNSSITNKLTIKYLFIPKFIGNFTIPEKVIKFYNVNSKKVDSLVIKVRTIKVINNNKSNFIYTTPSNNESSNVSTSLVTNVVTSEKEISYIQKNIEISKNPIFTYITKNSIISILLVLNILVLTWAFLVSIFNRFISRNSKAILLSSIGKNSDINKIKNLSLSFLSERSKGIFKGKSIEEIVYYSISNEFQSLREFTNVLEKLEHGKYSKTKNSSLLLKEYIKPSDLKNLIINLDKDEKWEKL